MNIEEFREYCLQKKGVTEEFPFDEVTLVFKVMGKMFALTGLDDPEFNVNLKCDPELAVELREQYPSVKPGYHMNKAHWNTVYIDGSVSDQQIREWTDHSYNIVASKLSKTLKKELGIL
jgi:predicted DNA-binding protein (MmcQ/YjbR family)